LVSSLQTIFAALTMPVAIALVAQPAN